MLRYSCTSCFGFGGIANRFVQMIERSRTVLCIDLTDGSDGFVDGFAGDKTGVSFLKKLKRAGEILQTLHVGTTKSVRFW